MPLRNRNQLHGDGHTRQQRAATPQRVDAVDDARHVFELVAVCHRRLVDLRRVAHMHQPQATHVGEADAGHGADPAHQVVRVPVRQAPLLHSVTTAATSPPAHMVHFLVEVEDHLGLDGVWRKEHGQPRKDHAVAQRLLQLARRRERVADARFNPPTPCCPSQSAAARRTAWSPRGGTGTRMQWPWSARCPGPARSPCS